MVLLLTISIHKKSGAIAQSLEQCFSNFCAPGRTYETTKTLRRTIVIYIAKLVMNFRNRKIIKNLLEITIFILEQYILHSNILMGNMRLVRFWNFVNAWPYM